MYLVFQIAFIVQTKKLAMSAISVLYYPMENAYLNVLVEVISKMSIQKIVFHVLRIARPAQVDLKTTA